MAGFLSSIGDYLFGRTKAVKIGQLEDEKDRLLRMMENAANDSELENYRKKLKALENSLMDEYKRQGLVNPDGSLKPITAFMDKFIDRDFLQLASEQGREARDIASMGMKQNLVDRASGKTGQPIGALASNLENRMKASYADMLNKIKQEKEIAYNKAAQDVASKKQFAQQYSAQQRQAISDMISTRKEELAEKLGYSQAKINQLANSINTMPDAAIGQVLKVVGTAVGTYFGGPIGGALGGAAGDALGEQIAPGQTATGMEIDPSYMSGLMASDNDMYRRQAPAEADYSNYGDYARALSQDLSGNANINKGVPDYYLNKGYNIPYNGADYSQYAKNQESAIPYSYIRALMRDKYDYSQLEPQLDL
jgi:hypothetical protein